MAWLSGWSYRKTVSITGQTGAGTDYQVDFSIGDGSGGDFHLESHCTSFPNDIQVTDNDQTTTLDYWVENLTVDPIKMWVEVADDLGSNVDVCVYYGKSGESTASNGTNTFSDLFDDFPGSSLDLAKWDIVFGSPVVENGYVKLTHDRIETDGAWGTNKSIRMKVKLVNMGGDVMFGWLLGTLNESAIFRTYSSDMTITSTVAWANRQSLSWTATTSELIYDIHRNSTTSTIFKRNGIIINTHNSQISPENMPIRFNLDSIDEVWIDWALVREYHDPEPAFSSAGSEENPPSVTVPVFMHSYRNLRET